MVSCLHAFFWVLYEVKADFTAQFSIIRKQKQSAHFQLT